MRIVYLYTALTTLGGVDRVLSVKANYLADVMGHDVWIVTDSQAGRPPVFPLSEKVHHIDLETDFDEQYHHGLLRRFWIYRRLMRQYRHRLERLLMELHADVVCTTLGREMDFLMEIHDGSRKVGESHIAKPFCRNFHLMEARGFPYSWVARYWRRKQESAVAQLDALVVLTQRDADSWASVREACVIHNPCTIMPVAQRTPVTDSRVVIAVGRLSEQKAFHRLIEAWREVHRRHPEWQLHIWGEGELQAALQQQIDGAGLTDNCRLCGTTSAITNEYAQAAIYAMTSRFEGFPLVLIEAMSSGLPVVAMDCPTGCREIITSPEVGLLVPDDDISAMTQALCTLIDNPTQRLALAQAGQQYAQQHFSLSAVMNQWISLFEKLKS